MDWFEYCGCNLEDTNCSSVFHFTAFKNDDLSPCLQLLIQGGGAVLLLIFSISYMFNFCGYRHERRTYSLLVQYLTAIRGTLCVVIAASTSALGVIKGQTIKGEDTLGSTLYYIVLGLSLVCWCIYGLMLFGVRYVFPRFKRAPAVVLLIYFLNVIIFGKDFQSYWVLEEQSATNTILLLYSMASLCHVFLIVSLLPSGLQHTTLHADQDGPLIDEQSNLINTSRSRGYSTFSDVTDNNLLGEDGGVISRLLFWWVNPLMKRGKLRLIQHAEDMFHLPKGLRTGKLADEFYSNLLAAEQDRDKLGRPKYTLMSALNRTFGLQYYALGIMKLIADGLGFAGPLLLNALISYMEDPAEVFWHGYLYAGGLFLTTLLASLLTAHFDYLIKTVQVKLTSAIVSCVYKRMLSSSTVDLSTFTTGETVNFMSTDVDRTVNFCASFHQFWSLPFQIAVSLYLLYLQVHWAFLAGVAFAIILIPINRQIAVKIGDLSTKMMSQKDARVKTMNELIYGIQVVKFFAWENYFLDRVNRQRSGELSSLKARKYLDALCVYFWATTPVIISILTFGTYVLLGNQLSAPKVFTSLALFNMLIGPLNAFPWVINGLVEAWVSVKRVQKFLNLKVSLQSQLWSGSDGSISVDGVSFSWSTPDSDVADDSTTHQPLKLKDINIQINKGELIGIIGKVGSGKTSLLLSFLNEMRLLREENSSILGPAVKLGSAKGVGLVTQQAWIQQGTLKDNIIMDKNFDYDRYCRAIDASALSEDLKNLQDGDTTEVGENGVTLSGGQKIRLTLARAIYQDFDIYLLDDPLAAVDNQVARHIFDNCVMGALSKKTRILCTHHVSYLWQANKIIVVDNGEIIGFGSPSDILPTYTDSVQRKADDKDSDTAEPSEAPTKVPQSENEEGAGAIVEEEKDSGTVKIHVYKLYARSVGLILTAAILLSLLLMQGSKNVTDWWLSYWISHSPQNEHSSNQSNSNFTFYLEVYGSLAGGNTFFTLFRAFLFAYGGICAAKGIHNKLLSVVSKAPMSFFDTTATGRIINRFSSDVYTVDDSLPFIANILLSQVFSILGTLVVTIYGLPWFAALLLPLGLIYYYIQGYYRHSSRELKRITSTTMSEVYSHLNQSVEGRIVIRAFNRIGSFESENIRRLERNQRANYSAAAASQWLNVRLQALGVVMVTGIALIAVLEHRYSTVDPGLVGLAISYALSITNLLSGVVSSFTETEKQMVSVERVNQYLDKIVTEHSSSLIAVDPNWPRNGEIVFDNVSVRYRPQLPYVIEKLTLRIQASEKIGIIGRTGSGKSTIFNVLFRMVDNFLGNVIIDGVNIGCIDLKTLRSNIAIIPQTPFLFSGTIRENLDPCEKYTDDMIWQVLDKCHLLTKVKSLGGLSAELAERGKLFSIGQSQLLCLARAMLLHSKVLCIDEATANVDLDTDSLIQQTIREEFKDCTVLTIAHRVTTILQCDRILVMSKGKLVEVGPPQTLLNNPSSHLTAMVDNQLELISG